ncbi:MAG: outer membrane beta-barrel protein [Verrucomicrobiota bacterium]
MKFILGSSGISQLHVCQPKKLANIQAIRISMNTLKLRISMRLLLAMLSGCVALTVRAQDFYDADSLFAMPLAQTTQFGITPFYGYRFGGEVKDSVTGTEYSFDDGPAFGLCLDYAPLGYLGRFELLWSHQDSSIDFNGNNGLGKVDLMVDVVQIGGVVEYGPERFRGYVSAHVGATHYSSDGYGDDTRFSCGIGAGVKAYLTKNLYLRADLRGFCTVVDAEGGFIYFNGITVASFSGDTLWQGQVSVGVGLTF